MLQHKRWSRTRINQRKARRGRGRLQWQGSYPVCVLDSRLGVLDVLHTKAMYVVLEFLHPWSGFIGSQDAFKKPNVMHGA
jgi:hypothetical protein